MPRLVEAIRQAEKMNKMLASSGALKAAEQARKMFERDRKLLQQTVAAIGGIGVLEELERHRRLLARIVEPPGRCRVLEMVERGNRLADDIRRAIAIPTSTLTAIEEFRKAITIQESNIKAMTAAWDTGFEFARDAEQTLRLIAGGSRGVHESIMAGLRIQPSIFEDLRAFAVPRSVCDVLRNLGESKLVIDEVTTAQRLLDQFRVAESRRSELFDVRDLTSPQPRSPGPKRRRVRRDVGTYVLREMRRIIEEKIRRDREEAFDAVSPVPDILEVEVSVQLADDEVAGWLLVHGTVTLQDLMNAAEITVDEHGLPDDPSEWIVDVDVSRLARPQHWRLCVVALHEDRPRGDERR